MKMHNFIRASARPIVAGLLVWLYVHPSYAQTSDIRLGTLQDLSGPLAGAGKQTLNGMRLRIDEIDAAGGIGDRKIALIAEDHGYDPKKAVLGAQKLIERDQVSIIIGQLGTATTLATMPLLEQKGVLNLFPLSSAREMYEPASPIKFAFLPPYFVYMRSTTAALVKQVAAKRPCALYQDDEFGLEILRGAETGLKDQGGELLEKVSYKRGATDFSSQVARLAASGCDLVVLGTVVRETVGVMTEAQKIGFKPTFLGSPGAYSSAVIDLGGKVVEGLYVAMVVEQPYVDSGPEELRRFAAAYKARFSEEATVFSSYGYVVIDLFAKAAQRTGTNFTAANLAKALESSPLPATPFGTTELTYSSTKRLGVTGDRVSRVSQVRNGRWVVVD
jgi:branched-chain amino acid transport system substrate-binding protein